MAEPLVHITAGALRGVTIDGVASFKGIPYGASTAGAGRFRRAAPPTPWSAVRDATSFGPSAPQPPLTMGMGATGEALAELVGANLVEEAQGEDCLVLNVWTPADHHDRRRPVMVWLHGGGWTHSSGSAPIIDGANLVRRGDVVVVTVNHRLGALGFLHLAGLDSSRWPDAGHVGMLDIVAALEWVRDEIACFGGDPGNVTVFGESGGGMKIATLLAMPAATGLFHKAIVQSGPVLRARTAEDATATAVALLRALGIDPDDRDDVARIEEVPAAEIVAAQAALVPSGLAAVGGGPGFSPVLDDRWLPAHPFEPVAAPTTAGVPLIIGTTRDELALYTAVIPGMEQMDSAAAELMVSLVAGARGGDLLELYGRHRPAASPADLVTAVLSDFVRVASIRMAERRLALDASPVWMYLFSYETDAMDGRLGAAHALDVPFTFDNVAVSPITGTRPERTELAAEMADRWIAFAATGRPDVDSAPAWPEYALPVRATLVLDVPSSVREDPFREERAAWDGIELPI